MSEIICADCLEVLKSMPDKSVDLVLTDPPYNEVNRESNGYMSLDKGTADSAQIDIPALAGQFVRIAAGSIYAWCGFRQVSAWCDELASRGLSIRVGVWNKTNVSPMNGDSLWLSGIELCVFGRKPNAYFSAHCKKAVWTGPSEQINGFPVPNPLWLMQELIEASCSPDGIVLDPFAGSGTTCVAAKILGRKYIGIEISPVYAEIARKRVEQAQYEERLFGDTSIPPSNDSCLWGGA